MKKVNSKNILLRLAKNKIIRLFFTAVKVHKSKSIVKVIWFKYRHILIALVVVLLLFFGIYYTLHSFSKRSILENNKILVKKNEKKCILYPEETWCVAQQKCLNPKLEFCRDATSKLVQKLEKNAGIAFTDEGKTNFIWNLKSKSGILSDKTVQGEIYGVSGVKLARIRSLESYLDSIAKLDKLNTVNGISGGLRGYYYNKLACTLDFRYREMRMNDKSVVVPVSDSLNVKFKCGYLEF